MSRFRSQHDYTGLGGIPSNTTWVGPWIWIENTHSLGFLIVVPGASNPQAAFTLQLSNDESAKTKTDAQLSQAPTSFALTAGQATAVNPAGAGVAINSLLQFERAGSAAISPMPRAHWARLVYTVTSGGAAGTGVTISLSQQGI